MPAVAAVSVRPTCAGPEMVGLPSAGVLVGTTVELLVTAKSVKLATSFAAASSSASVPAAVLS